MTLTNVRNSHEKGALFPNATNTVIQGGHFTVVNSLDARAGAFERLQQHVATSAFHNSAKRVDPPRCHQNTRLVLIQEIFNWIIGDVMRTAWIAWLNGSAGSGKSAIGQSIAEGCILRGIMVASFFFLRPDPTRNSIKPLVATLAYQVARILPGSKEFIIHAIDHNPLIFEQSLESQINELIIGPLRQLQASVPWKLLLIIDGVDECTREEEQTTLIRTLAKLLKDQDLPLIILLCSRGEHQIKMAFNAREIRRNLRRFILDYAYQHGNDVRLFLQNSFREIRETHPMSYLLEPNWPSPIHLQEILNKSSGQFIYGAVVVKFISHPRMHPATQLDIVRGLRPTGANSPFAELDAMYCHIFSQVRDLQMVISILAYMIIGNNERMFHIAQFLGFEVVDVIAAMADLAAVVMCHQPTIRFLHPSLPDFLLDPSRSHEYYIDRTEWSTRLSVRWFENLANDLFPKFIDNTVVDLLQNAEGNAKLSALVREASAYQLWHKFPDSEYYRAYLHCVRNMNLQDGGEAYRVQLDAIVRYLVQIRMLPARRVRHELEGNDILPILRKIEREECHSMVRIKSWVRRLRTCLM